ncbi:hypothetical protein F5X99DRAFT_397707 [Biscogniauxia marginata]|nr:hypothetical protein F5X99DRAFT_397707 [Biscogniauxia marginata]
MNYTDSPVQSQPGRLRRVPQFYKKAVKHKKNVRFAAGNDLEIVKVFDLRKAVTHREPVKRHKANGSPRIDKIPPLFRCKSGKEIIQLVEDRCANISEIYQGYNALHWYCNAKSTSPSLIEALIGLGIDINDVDQCHRVRSPIMRHTALGFACKNANVKAIHTLLQLGASPLGLERKTLPKYDSSSGKRLLYPSPLQVLLCQPINGPRPACPWAYHLTEEDEENNSYLDEENAAEMPEFRPTLKLPGIAPEEKVICQECTQGFHIWEPWPSSEEEMMASRENRRWCWYNQIMRVGARLQKCTQLLLDYSVSEPHRPLCEGDDAHLWSSLDYFLETSWRFLSAMAVCWREGGVTDEEVDTCWGRLAGVPEDVAFPPFGEICDMLLNTAGYNAEGPAVQARGQQRLVALIAQHPDFEHFKQGEFFDVDAELKFQQDGR